MKNCVVCQDLTNKYKCPRCFGPYCSLICYKQHKNSPECLVNLKLAEGTHSEANNAEIEEPTVHEPFKTEDTVAKEKLQKLGESIHLQKLLCNPHLRNLLTEIDTAPNAWRAIQAAMQEPLFLEFADECLKIVEPPTEVE